MNLWVSSALGYIPVIPLVFATIIGIGARPSEIRTETGSFNLYYATRPINSAEMYRAKLLAISMGVLLAALITIGVFFAWLWIPAVTAEGKIMPYFYIFMKDFTTDSWLGVLILGIGLIWCWRNQMVGAFTDFLPSRHFVTAYAFFVLFNGVLLMLVWGRDWWQGDVGTVLMAICTAILCSVKFAVSFLAGRDYLGLRPNGGREIAKIFLIWLGAVLFLQAMATWSIISHDVDHLNTPIYLRQPVCLFIVWLLIPLGRPILALAALENGRHRR